MIRLHRGHDSTFAVVFQAATALLLGTMLAAPFFLARRVPNPNGTGILKQVPSTDDMEQHLAVLEDFEKGLRAGNPYPRWQAGFDNGYGLPWLNFYPPGFYYLAEAVHLVLRDWIDTLFAVSVLSLAASALAFYRFARLFYGPVPCAVGALFYLLAPYHVLDLYWRAALPEFMGFVFVPLILYFAFLSAKYGRGRQLAGLGLCYGLFLLTHWPVAYLLTLALAVYVMVWAVAEKNWRIPARVAGAGVLGLLLSAIYWLPAALELRFVQEYWSTVFPYHSSYLPFWPVRTVMEGLLNQSLALEGFALLAAIVVLGVVSSHEAKPHGRPSKRREQLVRADPIREAGSARSQTGFLMMTGVVAALMVTPPAFYVSRLIPKMEVVYFAWRWLLVISFFAAVAVAAALERLRNRAAVSSRMLWIYRAGIVAAVLWNSWTTVQGVVQGAFTHPNLQRPASRLEGLFFPRGATPPNMLPDTPRVVPRPEGAQVQILRWEPLHREVVVAARRDSTLRLKSYNFPGWVGRLDGRPVEVHSDENGVQMIEVPSGQHRIEISFVNTLPRTSGAVISALALSLACGLILFDYGHRPTTIPLPARGPRAG